MNEARECALVMLESSEYILKELPNVKMSAALSDRTKEICAALNGTKHDVMSELFELDELVASAADDAVVNDRIDRVVRWLHDDIPALHALVTALDAAAKEDPACEPAYFLVSESATNVLNALNRTTSAVPDLPR